VAADEARLRSPISACFSVDYEFRITVNGGARELNVALLHFLGQVGGVSHSKT